ncbi:hypothetical protein HELRODRAFT_111169 [Helobdella robusta]|uniref:BEACH domain-containing protein n=1 Tax=Helobdella robusta TaxID=6412 RepID=T1EF90_HELRO|nr:hypothetical protein HELRODRAFT_111169 [Helobdella robusta]ESO05164.1 hypothetical protein HELRODRAFT_111169 [Helobdella robusta]
MSQECELITIYETIKGRLDITSTSLVFTNLSPGRNIPTVDVIRLPVDQLKEIHFRRYNLRRSALEFFLINQNNYFLNFEKSVRNKIYTRIIRLRPPNLVYYQSRSPAEIIKSSGLTQKWVQREMSNFEYLMQLNTISGRTYNDLSQYPVFPWVLSDYKSSTLNLDDPNVYRDLAWPIGAVNPRHREQLRDKYESLSDNSSDASDRFHYGTHYSNPAGVMHYLVRLEPFTSLHVQLQDGSFDVTDRQFHSLSSTWDTLMNNPNDVKELIPEFFYHPEFLVNVNDLDLGEMQNSDERFGDVILPPWASSANDFIDKHMQALESDYVSENLHKWVDLIFGYRQQGEAAVEALNVFYYCTYEGAVDLDAITDEKKKKALEGIIKNFGQAPSQLFKEPHPKRLSKREWLNQASKVDRVMCLFNSVNNLKIFQVQGAPSNGLPLVHVDIPNNQSYSLPQWNNASLNMICITADGVLGVHSWLPYDRNISNFFTFTSDVSMFNPRSQKKLFTSSSLATTYQSSSSASTASSTMKLFVVTPDARLIVSGGHWDNSMRVFSLVKMKQITSIVYHTDVITCLAMDRLGKRLVTGSRDATCIVWEIIYKGSKSETINSTPLKLLYGHSTEITCLSLSWELDVVVSGSKDGLVVVYTLQDGLYVRTLQPPHAKGWMVSVEQMAMSHLGHICVFCKHQIINSSSNGNSSDDGSRSTSISTGEKEKLTMHLYSINGKHLSKEDLQDHVSDMIIHSGFLLVGFSSGQFVIKKLYGLKTEATQNFNSAIKCLAMSPGGSHLLVGLISGWIMILALDRVSELK